MEFILSESKALYSCIHTLRANVRISLYLWLMVSSLFHTESIYYLVEDHQFSAFVCSHRTKQLRCKAAPVCQFIQQAGAADQKEASQYTSLRLWVFSTCCPQCPTVNINIYWLTVYNHMDAVIMCCEWDPVPPCIMDNDKVSFFALNYMAT